MSPAPAPEAMVRLAATAALDKRAGELVVLDLQGLSGVADFFLVCSARSATHAETVADGIAVSLRAAGARIKHREGTAASGWLLLDYGDVVAHVFLEDTRAFYALERLWGDAPLLAVDGPTG